MRSILLFTLIMWVTGVRAYAGHKMTRSEYIETYHQLAIREMERTGVPASITLAQGALESSDGNSTLAREANNHFGIKCHDDWNGKTIYQDDDQKDECFRKYNSVEDSYRDHSDYLRSKQRYAFLFDLPITDYRGWARGLKRAGYATNPSYAESLIRIIEEYGLSEYDHAVVASSMPEARKRHRDIRMLSREVGEINRVKYIHARAGDTYASLTAELGKLNWELPQYNDGSPGDSLVPGAIIYLQPKRNRAQAGQKTVTVQAGQTMLSISQQFAIKLNKLYELNRMKSGTEPAPGTVLQLRRPLRQKNTTVKQTLPKISGGEEEDDIKVDLNLN